MTKRHLDFTALNETTRQAIAPAMKLSELALQGFERAARQQHAFAGELLELALTQMQGPAQASDITELAARQAELTTQLVAKAMQRSQELVRLAGEQQAELTKWFDETATGCGAAVKTRAA